jgi:hypothetical protein
LEPVALADTIDRRHTDVCSNIEFSLVVQKWHDVFLQDMGSWITQRIGLFILNKFGDLFERLSNGDASSTVGIFARFDQPYITAFCAKLDSTLLRFLLLVVNKLVLLIVILQKFTEFFAVEILHMECYRDKFERIGFLSLVIALHIVEQCLLIT